MEHIERALIMAAGLGQRMRPVTLKTPKPLVPVNGERFIDNQMAALRAAGIYDVVMVVGYLAEQFRELEDQYPGLKLVLNPDYDKGGNITSMYYARHYLDRPVVIMDGDILIRNPKVLIPEISRSHYCCTWEESDPREWYFIPDEDWVITKVIPKEGPGWQLRGINFWTAADAKRLRRHLETAYEKEGLRDAFWDELPLINYWGEYKIGIRPLDREDIHEIDTFQDLCREDPSYISFERKGSMQNGHSKG